MPTNTAAIVLPAIIAANASAKSARAQDTACAAMLTSFDSHNSTAAQRQQYAVCVDRLEAPPRMSNSELTGVKVIVGVLLVFLICGAIWGAREDPTDRVLGGFMGMVTGFLVFMGGALMIGLIAFLFS